jgi:5-carboxymethyl-2-hydroxymuconic-semialdehyde dehydrogenase/aminomuconate-semialdehyde/2-hydroxymuconate-6-semialdehyde dehydrogenase
MARHTADLAPPALRSTARVARSIIGGTEVLHDRQPMEIVNPATGGLAGLLAPADAREVARAVAAARAAFDRSDWPRWSVPRRQALMLAIRDRILAEADRLAEVECLALGVPLGELKARHMLRAAENFRFFAEYIGQARGDLYDQTPGYRSVVVREPVGVAALIAPWNAPVALASMKLAAALAFGNTCVLKPSEQTPFALHRLVEILHEAGVPDGVVNLVNGPGDVTGAALVADVGVDLISFTGGTATGRAIMAEAGRRLVPCTMELGGKSANIVFASADRERALDAALASIYSNNGQQCLAGSRIFVERAIAEDFIADFVARARRIRAGDPMDGATELGPLATAAHRDRVLRFAAEAPADGVEILTGGGRPDGLPETLAGGHYVAPIAALAPDNARIVCQQEIFGPFATFQVFDTYEEVVAAANGTEYGLVSYVWSDHLPTVERAVRDLRSGVVWVNTTMTRELRAPFGGYRSSGVGREGGEACERFYTEPKTVTFPSEPISPRRFGAT